MLPVVGVAIVVVVAVVVFCFLTLPTKTKKCPDLKVRRPLGIIVETQLGFEIHVDSFLRLLHVRVIGKALGSVPAKQPFSTTTAIKMVTNHYLLLIAVVIGHLFHFDFPVSPESWPLHSGMEVHRATASSYVYSPSRVQLTNH